MHWTSYALPVIGMTLGFCCAFNCCRVWFSQEGCYDDESQRYMFWVNLGGVTVNNGQDAEMMANYMAQVIAQRMR